MKQLAHRRSMGIAGVVLMLTSLLLMIAGPAAAADGVLVEGNCNEQNGWTQNVGSGAWGSITNNGDGSVSVNLNAGYSLTLCVKGGSDHLVYEVSTTGLSGPYWPPANCGQGARQCGLSHWAIKDVDFETTTTTEDETTTTSEPEQSTTTSEPEQSTTTSEPEQSTTTSEPEQSTTTTRVEETTTTAGQTTSTVQETTSTVQETTSTAVEVSVAGIQVSAPAAAQATQATLPFTGVSSSGLAVIAAALAGLGALALGMAKRDEERSAVRSW